MQDSSTNQSESPEGATNVTDPTSIQTHLLEFVRRNCDNPGDIEMTTDLIATAAIDSLLVADLTAEIESAFDVTLSIRDISPEHFRTVENLARLITTKKTKQRDAA